MSTLPGWLHECARVLDLVKGCEGVVQFIGEHEDSAGVVVPFAVFLRPEGGGKEWIIPDHQALRQADAR